MRYTPFLDRVGVTFKDDVPDHAVNIIDSALAVIEGTIDWGEWEGKKRKPCPEQPLLLAGLPLGMYHCPVCGVMVLAGLPHISPKAHPSGCNCPAGSYDPGAVHEENCATNYPDYDYEVEYGRPWPAGYEG